MSRYFRSDDEREREAREAATREREQLFDQAESIDDKVRDVIEDYGIFTDLDVSIDFSEQGAFPTWEATVGDKELTIILYQLDSLRIKGFLASEEEVRIGEALAEQTGFSTYQWVPGYRHMVAGSEATKGGGYTSPVYMNVEGRWKFIA